VSGDLTRIGLTQYSRRSDAGSQPKRGRAASAKLLLVYELLRCGFSFGVVSGLSRSRSCMIGSNNCMNSRQIRFEAWILGAFGFGAQFAYRQSEFEKESITI
jgi:hypothetical protein